MFLLLYLVTSFFATFHLLFLLGELLISLKARLPLVVENDMPLGDGDYTLSPGELDYLKRDRIGFTLSIFFFFEHGHFDLHL